MRPRANLPAEAPVRSRTGTLSGSPEAPKPAWPHGARWPHPTVSCPPPCVTTSTELVSNAVRHAGVGPDRSLRIELRQWPRHIRVEVVDPGSHFARVRPRPITDDPGGWGLVLVERIAARWGVGHGESGTREWFEVEFER